MIKVFDAFRENNINIPFPQQDVHIKSFVAKPGDASEKINNK
jgi:small-conductance mechanosensitive channel